MFKLLKLTLFAITFFSFLVSCKDKPKYKKGDLPDLPVNLADFNSYYDDYNSTAPSLGVLIPFCFSTNRNSKGSQFDIIYLPMDVNFNKTTGLLTITNQYGEWQSYMEDYEVIKTGLAKINTTGNELGPNLIMDYKLGKFSFTFLYASDITGNFQVNYSSDENSPGFSESAPVTFLNSPFDDMYPTFNSTKDRLYFCSNRDATKFDIYYAAIPPTTSGLTAILADTSDHIICKDTVLSGSYDDKCPFIFNNMLVFTSNRPGGFGGYDLYYSVFNNHAWSQPVNFGPKINSEFDEYRPILCEEGVSESKTMMIFSSNRPGGQGGFDLYFVGVTLP